MKILVGVPNPFVSNASWTTQKFLFSKVDIAKVKPRVSVIIFIEKVLVLKK